MTNFEGVVPALGQALAKRGYENLTPVQRAVLAEELRDQDALVSAQTGSGKTVAFGLGMAPTLLGGADRLEAAAEPLALAVAPTRELALQVMRELEWLYEYTGGSVTSCVGGMDMRTERRALARGAHIVVGTPGRLRDHIERGSLDLSWLRVVVLDEADEMLDLGFREDLEYILEAAPDTRRTLMFSATVPKSIAALAKRYQRNAVRITTSGEESQHSDIEYRALACAPSDRENAIINVLRHVDPTTAIVFCATRATVNHLTSRFANRGISAVALSGELSQSERTHALQALRDGRAKVCIATDVAARGIDLPNLDLVVHADLPTNPASLLHRSGRTGRAGRKGASILIVPYPRRRGAERLLANAKVEASWGRPPSADEIRALDRQRILEDPDLGLDITDEEKSFAADLLARHGADAVAVAFLRKRMAGLTAPEELLDDTRGGYDRQGGDWHDAQGRRKARGDRPPRDEARKRPDAFDGGVWLRLSVGRTHRAEARWLLPMLCRAGNITKQHVGAIRIDAKETLVEMHPDAVAKFLEAVGPGRKVEKTISVSLAPGGPSGAADAGAEHPAGTEPQHTPRQPKRRFDKQAGKRNTETPDGAATPQAAPADRANDRTDDRGADYAQRSEPDAGAPPAPGRGKSAKPWKAKPKSEKAPSTKAKTGKPKSGKLKTGKPKTGGNAGTGWSADAVRPRKSKPADGRGSPKKKQTGDRGPSPAD